MNKKDHKSKIRPVLFAVGAGVALSLASIPLANAASGNFGTNQLSSGYNLADSHGATTDKADKKCGAGKCAAGKCGANKDKAKDGSNGANGTTDKSKDGKCGAGKCGANK